MSTKGVSVADVATSWFSVLLAIGAGVLAAFQVGKVHIALPSIRHSFDLSLVSASWLLSALSVVGLFIATPVGSYAGKVGTKKALILGLLLVAAASAAGAFFSYLRVACLVTAGGGDWFRCNRGGCPVAHHRAHQSCRHSPRPRRMVLLYARGHRPDHPACSSVSCQAHLARTMVGERGFNCYPMQRC